MRCRAFVVGLGPLAVLLLGGCLGSREHSTLKAAHRTLARYENSINSNNVDTLMEMFTDDIVFVTPHGPPIEGKPAVRAWCEEYLQAFDTRWEKASERLSFGPGYAFESYTWTATNAPRAGGQAVTDTGWGLAVYRLEPDGIWRVARDEFGPGDRPDPR